jgi:predicted nucleic acid-binding protein
MIPAAILDTTLLSNFAHLQHPELIHWAFGESLATTPKVMAELRVGEAEGLVPACDWTWLTVLELSQEEQSLAAEFSQQLDPGESECLAVAAKRQCKFLSDDFAARRMAQQQGLKVSGTLGVLLRLVDQQRLTFEAADALLQTLLLYGYRSPVQSLRDLNSPGRGTR